MRFHTFLNVTLLMSCLEMGTASAAATQLSIAAGNNQTAVVGTTVGGVVCVIVRDASNNPVSGVSVTWGSITGGGSLTGATQSTGADGIATLGSWTLGTV